MAKPAIEIIARGVWTHRGAVLVCRNRSRGHVFLPGGHVEFNEPAAEALGREMSEETGLSFHVGAFRGGCEAIFDQRHRSGTRRHHEINLLFEMEPATPLPADAAVPSREPEIAFEWLDLAALRAAFTAQTTTAPGPGPGPGPTTEQAATSANSLSAQPPDANRHADVPSSRPAEPPPLLPHGIIPLVLAAAESPFPSDALWVHSPPGPDPGTPHGVR